MRRAVSSWKAAAALCVCGQDYCCASAVPSSFPRALAPHPVLRKRRGSSDKTHPIYTSNLRLWWGLRISLVLLHHLETEVLGEGQRPQVTGHSERQATGLALTTAEDPWSLLILDVGSSALGWESHGQLYPCCHPTNRYFPGTTLQVSWC